MEKLKLKSSGITHTSNLFHVHFRDLKILLNLRQGQTESMDYFYKSFYSSLTTCKLIRCDTTSFPGLEKHTAYIKYDGQNMAIMCLIKTYYPLRFFHFCNELKIGTILGDSTNMYPKTISKAYDVLESIRHQKIARIFLVTTLT